MLTIHAWWGTLWAMHVARWCAVWRWRLRWLLLWALHAIRISV